MKATEEVLREAKLFFEKLDHETDQAVTSLESEKSKVLTLIQEKHSDLEGKQLALKEKELALEEKK